MKAMFAIVALIFLSSVYADELKVDIDPSRPVVGDVFQAHFRISTDSTEEPNITFSPSGIEVVGKSNQGISTRTVYANGRLSVTREVSIVYDLVAAKPGNAFLRDIKAEFGNKTLRHPVVSVDILKEPQEVPEVFVMADVPKKSLYVGEGVTVRYYLYSKVAVNNVDIKKYPKLNGFLKRFLQEPDRSERVSVDGQLYMRTQIYAAKLFPEKAGELKVDPLEISATYPQIRPGDPFGAFGMGRNFRTRTISSETVKVQSLPLPQPAPSNFSGLVGKHDIQLQLGQTKLIVNEPLEIKLTVSGGGALENLEAPVILKNPAFEEFESNGDLKIANADEATKTFDYTFLAKENIKLEPGSLSLSYFDPIQEKYVPVELQIPQIEVAGGDKAAARPPEKKSEPEVRDLRSAESVPQRKPEEMAGPVLVSGQDVKSWIPFVNISLAAASILIALGWAVRRENFAFVRTGKGVPSQFRKGNFSLGEFTKWLSPAIQRTGKSPSAIIKDSPLDADTKTYFIDLLQANDYKDYSARKTKLEFNYHPGHFKKLGRYIESLKDENSSQSA